MSIYDLNLCTFLYLIRDILFSNRFAIKLISGAIKTIFLITLENLSFFIEMKQGKKIDRDIMVLCCICGFGM